MYRAEQKSELKLWNSKGNRHKTKRCQEFALQYSSITKLATRRLETQVIFSFISKNSLYVPAALSFALYTLWMK